MWKWTWNHVSRHIYFILRFTNPTFPLTYVLRINVFPILMLWKMRGCPMVLHNLFLFLIQQCLKFFNKGSIVVVTCTTFTRHYRKVYSTYCCDKINYHQTILRNKVLIVRVTFYLSNRSIRILLKVTCSLPFFFLLLRHVWASLLLCLVFV